MDSSICRLTYFAGRGLGERIRYMLWECGIQYEERIISKELLAELRSKDQLLFQQLPLLEIDGLNLIQSSAILRYLARKHDMYGRDQLEAVQCDMIADGLIDILMKLLRYPFVEDKESLLATNVLPYLPRYLNPLQERIKGDDDKGPSFIFGQKINFPDLLLLELLETIHDISPSELEAYPHLKAYYHMMCERPSIKKFHTSGRHYLLPGDVYKAHVNEVLDR